MSVQGRGNRFLRRATPKQVGTWQGKSAANERLMHLGLLKSYYLWSAICGTPIGTNDPITGKRTTTLWGPHQAIGRAARKAAYRVLASMPKRVAPL